jgi:hypothetical protein
VVPLVIGDNFQASEEFVCEPDGGLYGPLRTSCAKAVIGKVRIGTPHHETTGGNFFFSASSSLFSSPVIRVTAREWVSLLRSLFNRSASW